MNEEKLQQYGFSGVKDVFFEKPLMILTTLNLERDLKLVSYVEVRKNTEMIRKPELSNQKRKR